MAIYLIRHADAGDRSAWRGDDSERPLSQKGKGQSEGVRDALEGHPIGRLFSSPSRRCVETLEPLADALDIETGIETVPQLAEGADADATIELLLAHATENPAASSHGDVIPKVIRRLVSMGMRPQESSDTQKGALWILDVHDGQVVDATYLPPHIPSSENETV